jgi:hypothetical protein
LNKFVIYTRGLLGKCNSHSLGMPLKPQAFPYFKDCISFETTQGQKLTGMSSSTVASRA